MLPIRSRDRRAGPSPLRPWHPTGPTTWPPLKPPPATTAENTCAVMVPSAVPRRLPHDLRRAAEFAAPPDDGAVQQAALGQVLQQRRHALVHFRQLPAHGLEMLLVRVPTFVIDGDEGHAASPPAAGPPGTTARRCCGRSGRAGRPSPATDRRLCRRRRESGRRPAFLASSEGRQLRIAPAGVLQRVQLCSNSRRLRCRSSEMPAATTPSTAKRFCAGSPPVAKGL